MGDDARPETNGVSEMSSLTRGLRVLQLVRDGGPIRLTEAAGELGLALSSTHRVLRALVKSGFLIQDDDRRYVAGPALRVPPVVRRTSGDIRRAAAEPLTWLAGETGHSSNLMFRVGSSVRFLACHPVPRGTPDRSGLVTDAHTTAGGRAILALFNDATLTELFPAEHSDSADLARLRVSLDEARRFGYATATRSDEPLSAIGFAVEANAVPAGRVALAISIVGDRVLSRRDAQELAVSLREASRRLSSAMNAA